MRPFHLFAALGVALAVALILAPPVALFGVAPLLTVALAVHLMRPGLLATLLLALALAAPAFAQDVAITGLPDDISWLGLVQSVVLLLISGLIIPLVLRKTQEAGVKIDQKHALILNLAARNIAAALLDPTLSPGERRTKALTEIHSRAAEAIKALEATDANLLEIIESYREQLKLGVPTSVDVIKL